MEAFVVVHGPGRSAQWLVVDIVTRIGGAVPLSNAANLLSKGLTYPVEGLGLFDLVTDNLQKFGEVPFDIALTHHGL